MHHGARPGAGVDQNPSNTGALTRQRIWSWWKGLHRQTFLLLKETYVCFILRYISKTLCNNIGILHVLFSLLDKQSHFPKSHKETVGGPGNPRRCLYQSSRDLWCSRSRLLDENHLQWQYIPWNHLLPRNRRGHAFCDSCWRWFEVSFITAVSTVSLKLIS